MDSYSSTFKYKTKMIDNLSANCGREKWEMNAIEQAECVQDDITILVYFMLFVFYMLLFSSLETRR
jgi:hypothetical protein